MTKFFTGVGGGANVRLERGARLVYTTLCLLYILYKFESTHNCTPQDATCFSLQIREKIVDMLS